LEIQSNRLVNNESKDANIHLDYPYATVYGHRVFLASHIFGVQRSENFGAQLPSSILHANLITLRYFAQADSDSEKNLLTQLELQLFALSLNDSFSDLVRFHVYADQVPYFILESNTKRKFVHESSM
jgi:hypothetical protein